ncbi:MAG: DUF481 domain-containing protein [Kiritimatiellae bacterium]|nr:DUF481 domain-containing protein [Kiritimatiellia bacterium]
MLPMHCVRYFRLSFLVGLVASMALAAAVAPAQAPAPAAAAAQAPAKKEGWNSEINAGLNLTRGNSKTLLVNGGILSEYIRNENELRLGLQGAYGESALTGNSASNKTEQTTVQNAKGTADYRRLFSERDYGYANGELMHDAIAGIDYRLIMGPGVGRYFLKSDLQKLSAEAGVAYVRQRREGDINNTVNLRVAQRYEIKFLEKSKLWESVELLPAFNDFSNYFINFEIGAEAPMAKDLSLRIVLQDQYNNRPARDKDKNDVQLIAGVAYKI